MPRPKLVAASLSVHAAIVIALFIAGFWRLDRLDSPRHRVDLAVAAPPPPAPAGSPAGAKVEIKHKQAKRITRDIVVAPTPEPEVAPKPAADTPENGDGNGSGSGSGSGSGDPDSTGDCTENCGPSDTKKPEPRPPVTDGCGRPQGCAPRQVPPPVLRGMRIHGETQIQMPDIEKTALLRSGRPRAVATVKVCVGSGGQVTSLEMFKGSGYAGWDGAILRAMRDWQYKPYRIGNAAVAVCGMVTFLYAIK